MRFWSLLEKNCFKNNTNHVPRVTCHMSLVKCHTRHAELQKEQIWLGTVASSYFSLCCLFSVEFLEEAFLLPITGT